MEPRNITCGEITAAVKKLFIDCNYFIGEDILSALKKSREKEESPVGKSVLDQIIENDILAAKEELPLCQDTGMAVLFVEYGDKVFVTGGSFEEAVNEGVRQAYRDGYLRKSVVSDPVFDRVNTKDNTPAVIHTRVVPGDKRKITVVFIASVMRLRLNALSDAIRQLLNGFGLVSRRNIIRYELELIHDAKVHKSEQITKHYG